MSYFFGSFLAWGKGCLDVASVVRLARLLTLVSKFLTPTKPSGTHTTAFASLVCNHWSGTLLSHDYGCAGEEGQSLDRAARQRISDQRNSSVEGGLWRTFKSTQIVIKGRAIREDGTQRIDGTAQFARKWSSLNGVGQFRSLLASDIERASWRLYLHITA